MSTPTAKPNSASDDKGDPSGLYVTVKGKIDSHKKITPESGNDFIQTLIVMPAKDAYSHPSTFAVNSDARLGSDGSEVTVPCELRPYARKKTGKSITTSISGPQTKCPGKETDPAFAGAGSLSGAKEKGKQIMKRIFAALSALIFASPAYAVTWTPLIQAEDFTGIKTDLGTAVGGVVLLLFVIVGIRYLTRILS